MTLPHRISHAAALLLLLILFRGLTGETVANTNADGSLVHTVEQPLTVLPRSWTHAIAQAGDYQVGMAWVEVETGSHVALEIFKNGSERLKALYVPAGEVTRFESRIEGLAAGDTLTVKITPNGGRYRAGYQIACGTPNFDGLPTFDVAAYGAVGDGTTDDYTAIQGAVTAAIQAGGGIVQFDGTRTYRAIGANDGTIENLIELLGVRDIKIQGNGATIMLHPPDRLVMVEGCENIQIDGFTMSYDPIPYYQGTIDAIDLNNKTADITVPERYEVPVVGENTLHTFFAFTFIPKTPGSRVGGDGRHFYIESTGTIGGDPRKIRLQGDSNVSSVDSALRHALDNGATEIIVPHLTYGHRGQFSIHVEDSSRVTVSNLLCLMMPHMGIFPGNNVGPVTFSNVDLLMENPDTELYWSWRGAYSVTGHNRWGFLIEDSEWHGCAMYDDVLAFFMRRQDIKSISDRTLSLELGEWAPLFRVGDWISIWTQGQAKLRGMSRITEVGRKKADGTFDIMIESPPPGMLVNDVAINEELYNRDTMVRNCRNYPQGASSAGTRIRTGGHFLDCDFEGLYLQTEYQEFFRPVRARNFVLENSTIRSSKWSRIRFDAAINPKIVGCTLDETYVLGDTGAQDIHLESNAWTNMTGNIVDLDNGSNARLFGNTSRNGITSGLSSHVSVDGTSSIQYAPPLGDPAESPPVSMDFEPPAAPDLAAVAGEGRVSLDWSDSAEVASYTVYRSLNASGPFLGVARTESSSYVDTGLTPGVNVHYVVTATDGSGNESVFSNIVSAQPMGTHLTPQADAYVHGGSFANTNFGSNPALRCKTDAANEGFTRESYLRFNLSALSGTIGSARLRLKVASTTGSGDTHTAHAVANDGWGESTLTWNNKPAAGSALASAVSPQAGGWIELDVTGQVASELAGDKNFSTVLISAGIQLVDYHSKEAGTIADRPRLTVAMMTGAAPAAPTGLTASPDWGAGHVSLNWNDQELSYRVYRSPNLDGPFAQVIDTANTSYLDNDVVPGQIYYYRIAAIDSEGNASDLSAAVSATKVQEVFDYFDNRRLAGGTPNRGSGWMSGWQALSGGGLTVLNGRIDQTGGAGSTRELAIPFALDPPGDHYFSFFARANATGSFSLRLKQTSPGPYVRWAFTRNADGSMTIQGGTATVTSAPGVFAANKEYLVVSKFKTNGDIAFVKLIDPENPGDYTSEPSIWDLSVSGLTGVNIDSLDLLISSGRVLLDDFVIGGSYAEVIGAMVSEVPVPLSPAQGASSPNAFPNFSWSEHRQQFREMAAPVNYVIEIAADAAFTTIVDSDVVGLPRYVHDQPFVHGTYHWRVRSITDAGRFSAWSAVRSFMIAPHDETVTVNHDAMAADHGAAVLAAVAQTAALAIQGKSVKLVFPAGDYHFADASMGPLIALDGVSRVSIEGTGAHLHFTSRKQTLISSTNSTEVSVSDFRISYATGALRIQGTVAAVNLNDRTVTLAIEPGYPDFTASDSHASDIFLLLDPVINGRQKTGSVSFYRMVANAYSQNPDGTWAVTLDRAAIPEWQVGDRFVYHFRAGSPVLSKFDGSQAITLHGLDIGGWGNMMISAQEGKASLFNILHVDTFHQDGDWMIGNADGVHLRGHKIGPWIEATRIQSIGDDGIALYARPASMSSAKPGGVQNAAVFVNTHFNLEAGDEVAFFEPTTGIILLETRVTSVVAQGGGWLVHFDDDLPDGMNFTGALVNMTQVWNRSKSCGDFMIRNGRMINNRRYATVFRARRGIVENMEYRGASSRSIVFVNETAFPNGLYASEIILRNNLVEDSGFVAGGAASVTFNFNGQGVAAQNIGPRNLLIDNHIFAECGTPEITMNHTRNVAIHNNRTYTGGGVFADAGYSAGNSESIVASMDDLSGDVTPPAPPTGLTVAYSSGAMILDWNRGGDLDAALFNVYRSTISGGPYTLVAGKLLASEYVDHTASPGVKYHYVITATDVSGNESGYGNQVSAIFGTDYLIWTANWPGVDLNDPTADYDGDLLTNEEERVWGLDPTDPTSRNPIIVPLDAAGTFSYTRRDPALTELDYTVWTSHDLLVWILDDGALQVPTPDAPAPDVETVEVTLTPALLGEPNLFIRVGYKKSGNLPFDE